MPHQTSTTLPNPGTTSSVPSSTPLPVFIESHPRVGKFLRHLPEKHRQQIVRKIEALKTDPYPADRRGMTGYPTYFRLDSGEYRIVFTEHKTATAHILTIVMVDRRNDDRIYDLVKRL